jgi:hypothetical protein
MEFLLKINNEMFNSPLYSDMRIKLRSGEFLYVHKYIVCNVSDMLRRGAEAGFMECSDSTFEFNHSDKLVIDVFKIIYIYDLDHVCRAYKILKFMHYLQMKEDVIKYFIQNCIFYDSTVSKLNPSEKIMLASLYNDLMPTVSKILMNRFISDLYKYDIEIDHNSYLYVLEYIKNYVYSNKLKHTLQFVIKYCKYTNNISYLGDFLLTIDYNTKGNKKILLKVYKENLYGESLFKEALNKFPSGGCYCTNKYKYTCNRCHYSVCDNTKMCRGLMCTRCGNKCINCMSYMKIGIDIICSDCVLTRIMNSKIEVCGRHNLMFNFKNLCPICIDATHALTPYRARKWFIKKFLNDINMKKSLGVLGDGYLTGGDIH